MFTIQSLMLVTLGFLLAGLLTLALAPAYRRRVARLTSEDIRRSIPVTEAEIKADKDRLRAQYAIRVHKLEAQNQQQRLAAARQLVELNRRDAEIAKLQSEIERIKAELEEAGNARRVLEHTVTDSLPKVEQRLAEARQLLMQRDREIAELNQETMKSVRALDEAMQINAQQRQEIERMASALSMRAAVNRDGLSDSRLEGEIAYRAELEALRAKARDQASLISRLQAGAESRAAGVPSGNGAAQSLGSAETERLRQDLTEAEAALKAARSAADVDAVARGAEAKIAALQARIDDQAAEIAKLKAALKAYEEGEDGDHATSLRDSRLAAKARISSLQAQVTQQLVTIQRLRAEVASGNERLARQAAHFMEEMRRLGAGRRPASPEARRSRDVTAPRRSLAERISDAKPALAAKLLPSRQGEATAPVPSRAVPERATDRSKVSDYLKALSEAEPEAPHPSRAETTEPVATAASAPPENGRQEVAPEKAPPDKATPPSTENKPAKPRFRLMERITGIGKG